MFQKHAPKTSPKPENVKALVNVKVRNPNNKGHNKIAINLLENPCEDDKNKERQLQQQNTNRKNPRSNNRKEGDQVLNLSQEFIKGDFDYYIELEPESQTSFEKSNLKENLFNLIENPKSHNKPYKLAIFGHSNSLQQLQKKRNSELEDNKQLEVVGHATYEFLSDVIIEFLKKFKNCQEIKIIACKFALDETVHKIEGASLNCDESNGAKSHLENLLEVLKEKMKSDSVIENEISFSIIAPLLSLDLKDFKSDSMVGMMDNKEDPSRFVSTITANATVSVRNGQKFFEGLTTSYHVAVSSDDKLRRDSQERNAWKVGTAGFERC